MRDTYVSRPHDYHRLSALGYHQMTEQEKAKLDLMNKEYDEKRRQSMIKDGDEIEGIYTRLMEIWEPSNKYLNITNPPKAE